VTTILLSSTAFQIASLQSVNLSADRRSADGDGAIAVAAAAAATANASAQFRHVTAR